MAAVAAVFPVAGSAASSIGTISTLPSEEAAARVHLAGGELRAVEHADADALLVAGERRLETDPHGVVRLGRDRGGRRHHPERDDGERVKRGTCA